MEREVGEVRREWREGVAGLKGEVRERDERGRVVEGEVERLRRMVEEGEREVEVKGREVEVKGEMVTNLTLQLS